MKIIYPSVFNKAEVRKELDRLHYQCWSLLIRQVTTLSLLVRHIVLISFLEIGFDSTHGNPANTHSSVSKQEILLQNHKTVLDNFNIPNKQNDFD